MYSSDLDTFLTALYVCVDDVVKQLIPPDRQRHNWLDVNFRCGRYTKLTISEAITLCILGQWHCFPSERAYWRWAEQHLCCYFPGLPHLSQFNRQIRQCQPVLAEVMQRLSQQTWSICGAVSHEAIDCTAVPVRNRKRRGRGWFAGQADYGYGSVLGSYFGFILLVSATSTGVITGFGFAPARASDQAMAQTLLETRYLPEERLSCIGPWIQTPYLADMGFEGAAWNKRWREAFHADVLVPPKSQCSAYKQWPRHWRRMFSRRRQIIESVFHDMNNTFRLRQERRHKLSAMATVITAKAALHNFCIWFNRKAQRKDRAFAELMPC